MSTPDWFNDDRKYVIVPCGVLAVYAIVETVRTAKYLDHGWIHPLLIAGILAGMFCAGLCMRQEWSRWVGITMLGAGVSLVLWHAYLQGISVITVGALVCAPFFLWILWTLPITRVQLVLADPDFLARLREGGDEIGGQLESQERWKVVLLLRHAIDFDSVSLARIAEHAFGKPFAAINRRIDPVDASFLPSEYHDPVVAGAAPVLVCYNPPHLLGVYVVPAPYPGLPAEDEALYATTRGGITEHRACIEIEVLPYVNGIAPVENGYACSGKLAAQLMDDQCLAIYLPERDRLFLMSSTLPDALRSSDPNSALNLQ